MYVTDGTIDVRQYEIGTTGALTLDDNPPSIGTLGEATAIAVSPNGQHAYAVNGDPEPNNPDLETMSQFTVSPDSLTLARKRPAHGEHRG